MDRWWNLGNLQWFSISASVARFSIIGLSWISGRSCNIDSCRWMWCAMSIVKRVFTKRHIREIHSFYVLLRSAYRGDGTALSVVGRSDCLCGRQWVADIFRKSLHIHSTGGDWALHYSMINGLSDVTGNNAYRVVGLPRQWNELFLLCEFTRVSLADSHILIRIRRVQKIY